MDAEKDKPEESLENSEEKNDDEAIKNKDEEAKPAESTKPEGESAAEPDVGEGDSEKKDGDADQESGEVNILQESPPPSAFNLDKLSQEVDEYLATLSVPKDDESSIPHDVPSFVKQFSLMVEARVADYDAGDSPIKWSSLSEEETASFLEAITRLSSLSIGLLDFSSQPNIARFINRIGGVLERALCFIEEEFKSLLQEYLFQENEIDDDNNNNDNNTNNDSEEAAKGEDVSEENPPPPPESARRKEENFFPGYQDEVLSNLIRLSGMMVGMGYETECCEAYLMARRTALDDSLNKLGFEKHSIDDVQRMQWEFLEREIVSWIGIFKQCTSLFSCEQKLAKSVFPQHPSLSQQLFGSLAQGVSATVLNFAGAVALTKSSSEKLFKFLDMYEILRDVVPAMGDLFPEEDEEEDEEEEEEWVRELKAESSIIKSRLGEAIVSIFWELETSIKADAGKTPVPGGAIHPLTRYTMNYLKYACEYKETLENIFKEHQKIERADSDCGGAPPRPPTGKEASTVTARDSPFETQMVKIMVLLDGNLEAKSKLYKDHALGAIFLMNNGRYVLQKVRGSNEINSLMGDAWCRKKSTDLRQYHKVYQRETWGKLLSYLHPDGLTSHGKVVKPVLKERFKNFNVMFDEIHRTQTTWIVCDEQLQSELRVSISNMVVPAYRSFLGRYSQVFTPGRQTEKYVKYQGEDIENSIEELFDGKK